MTNMTEDSLDERTLRFWMLSGAGVVLAVLAAFAVVATRPSVAGPRSMDEPDLPPIEAVEHAVLTEAPFVPPPIGRDHAAHVVVDLETTGPGGTSSFTFRALNPGLYVYHCAVAPVGMHIANGMYGLILVEPAEGLPPVDREFYVMQGEFYTEGRYGEAGHQAFSYDKAVAEAPDYLVFNGRVGSMVGEGALRARVGERVRLFVGNGGPNLVSSFHVIGEIFDNVYAEGGTVVNNNVQTTLVPAGGAAITEFRLDVPGTYVMVDHAIFRAFEKGALGTIEVTGEARPLVLDGAPAR